MPAASSFAVKLQDATVEAERLGELFLINREQMIAADKQRQGTREALTALRQQPQQSKAWLLPGGASAALGAASTGTASGGDPTVAPAFSQSCGTTLCFARYKADDAVRLLEDELASLDARLDALRAEQKRLTAQLADVGAAPQSASLDAMLRLRG